MTVLRGQLEANKEPSLLKERGVQYAKYEVSLGYAEPVLYRYLSKHGGNALHAALRTQNWARRVLMLER